MTTAKTRASAKQSRILAEVIRKDGTRENLGVIAYWHRSVWKRLSWLFFTKNGRKYLVTKHNERTPIQISD